MSLIALSGQPGCRFEEVARIAANRLAFELVTASHIASLVETEFAPLATVPDKAYLDLVASIVARLAISHHLLICGDGLELLSKQLPGMLRVNIVAPDSVRVGNIMLDERLERPAARQMIRAME
jgi:hypothetical protein